MRAFDGLTRTPCPVCSKLAQEGQIQPRAVMPLPKFPARLRSTNEQCCRDCQAADTVVRLGGHPMFGPARLTVANERVEGLTMPRGMMEHFGLCSDGIILPCSNEDLDGHLEWLAARKLPDGCCRCPIGVQS